MQIEHHPVKIKSALISVYYKDKLEPIIHALHRLGVVLYSTGGTRSFIEDLGVPVQAVEDLTLYPSILGGRVKTLHPKVFGGILARRASNEDQQQLTQYHIPEIDLVIVDLYPFEETIRHTTDHSEIIEKIDIGGVSLIRAAAKNYHDVLIIASKDDYSALQDILDAGGETKLGQRMYFAKKAFNITSSYDSAIFGWMDHGEHLDLRYAPKIGMRYGENPHQQAAFYGHLGEVVEQIQGKEISYNNLVDIESCIYLMEEFEASKEAGKATFAIIKHTNACGLATADSVESAWDKALAADPVSAFGGVLICNQAIDKAAAGKINELFFEVIIAPDFDAEALALLQSKKNRIILRQRMFKFPVKQFKTVLNGVLMQDRNVKATRADELMKVTDIHPTEAQIQDLLFAEVVVKHLKSNGIALVRNGQLIGCGTGQTSRVDALKQALAKAALFGFDVRGSVMASEAFFPFPDCVQIAHEAGISAVIQPGGSVRDKDSIDYCNTHGLPMVLSGTRHFKH